MRVGIESFERKEEVWLELDIRALNCVGDMTPERASLICEVSVSPDRRPCIDERDCGDGGRAPDPDGLLDNVEERLCRRTRVALLVGEAGADEPTANCPEDDPEIFLSTGRAVGGSGGRVGEGVVGDVMAEDACPSDKLGEGIFSSVTFGEEGGDDGGGAEIGGRDNGL